MTYTLSILPRAIKELRRLPRADQQRIESAIAKLARQPRPAGAGKLKGREGWRIRIGVYRIIYEVNDDELAVIVLHVGHRRDVYE